MTRAERKEGTRRKLLIIAKAAFTGRPYEDVTVRSIAQAAGVSTGSIFGNFAGKEGLYLESMGREPGIAGIAEFVDRVAIVCAGMDGAVGALSLEAQELRASINRGG